MRTKAIVSCTYCEADLRLCFRLYRLLAFPCAGPYIDHDCNFQRVSHHSETVNTFSLDDEIHTSYDFQIKDYYIYSYNSYLRSSSIRFRIIIIKMCVLTHMIFFCQFVALKVNSRRLSEVYIGFEFLAASELIL